MKPVSKKRKTDEAKRFTPHVNLSFSVHEYPMTCVCWPALAVIWKELFTKFGIEGIHNIHCGGQIKARK